MAVDMTKARERAEKLRADAVEILDNALRSCGWVRSCDNPGSLWLWSKSFPPSNTQARIQKDGSRKPWPGATYNGLSFEAAIHVEASWQQVYDDTCEFYQEPEHRDD